MRTGPTLTFITAALAYCTMHAGSALICVSPGVLSIITRTNNRRTSYRRQPQAPSVQTTEPQNVEPQAPGHRGRTLISIADLGTLEKKTRAAKGEVVYTSKPIDVGIDANEFIVSWNASAPPNTGLKV